MTALGRIGAVGAQPVERSGREIRQIAVPHGSAAFGQDQALRLVPAVPGEQAELDPGRVLGEHGDVSRPLRPIDAQGVGPARQDLTSGLELQVTFSTSSE